MSYFSRNGKETKVSESGSFSKPFPSWTCTGWKNFSGGYSFVFLLVLFYVYPLSTANLHISAAIIVPFAAYSLCKFYVKLSDLHLKIYQASSFVLFATILILSKSAFASIHVYLFPRPSDTPVIHTYIQHMLVNPNIQTYMYPISGVRTV